MQPRRIWGRVWGRRLAVLGVVLGLYSAIGLPGVGRTETVKAPACSVCRSAATPTPSKATPVALQETSKTNPPSTGVVVAGLVLAVLLVLAGSTGELAAVPRTNAITKAAGPARAEPSTASDDG